MKRLKSLLAIGVACFGFFTGPVSFSASELSAGQSIGSGGVLASKNGLYELRMQTDGNLVLYELVYGTPTWASNTQGYPGAAATMQTDGNLVVYDSYGAARWASGTNPTEYAHLSVQDDGNLVIYGQQPVWWTRAYGDCGTSAPYSSAPSVLTRQSTLAASGMQHPLSVGDRLVSPNLCYEARMQTDGNFVVYRRTDNRALWASNTSRSGAWLAWMQNDTNFVLYAVSNPYPGAAKWSSQTPINRGGMLKMQNDGNLVLYTDPVAVWAKGKKYNYKPDPDRCLYLPFSVNVQSGDISFGLPEGC